MPSGVDSGPLDARPESGDRAAAAALRGRPLRLIGWTGMTMAIVLLSWPVASTIRTGLDFSWRMALHLAAADGLRYGHDILFTYGPLGFLSVPAPFVGPTSALAFLFTGLVYFSLVGMVLVVARRLFPRWLAVGVTLLLGRAFLFLPPFEALQALAFMLAVEVVAGRLAVSWRVVAVVGGALAAVALLGKLNVGVFVFALGGVAAVAASPRRPLGLAVFAAAVGGTLIGLWLVAGQQPGDLVAYARGSLDIVAGYSDAMGTDRDPLFHWIYLAWALVVGLLAWLGIGLSASWSTFRRLALLGLLLVLAFSMWKTSFVRGYPGFAFATAMFAGLVMLRPSLGRQATLLALLALGLAFLGTGRVQPVAYLGVTTSAREGIAQARDALLPFRWNRAAERVRDRLRRRYALPPSILAELGGRTVHVDPFEAAVVTAYPDLRWRPTPVFQSYSAYTSALDEANAAFLRSPDRPARILRSYRPLRVDGGRSIPLAVDGRFYWFDAPAATVERLCRYTEVAATSAWQVLADTGRSCGAAIPLGRVDAAVGQPVAVPAAPFPNDLVVVRIHGLEPGLVDRIRTSLWKSPEWYVTLDGFEYRFVTGTAGDGLVLAVPASAQGSGPFRFGEPIETIALRERDTRSSRRLTYEFAAVPLPAP